MSQKKTTHFETSAEYKIHDSGVGERFQCMDSLWIQLSYTTTGQKIFHDWVSTDHCCKGYDNYVAQ